VYISQRKSLSECTTKKSTLYIAKYYTKVPTHKALLIPWENLHAVPLSARRKLRSDDQTKYMTEATCKHEGADGWSIAINVFDRVDW